MADPLWDSSSLSATPLPTSDRQSERNHHHGTMDHHSEQRHVVSGSKHVSSTTPRDLTGFGSATAAQTAMTEAYDLDDGPLHGPAAASC
jgi:hypothetical protein